MMARKPTKTQMKRAVEAIQKKTFNLYQYGFDGKGHIVTTADMAAIEKLCMKWMKRIG